MNNANKELLETLTRCAKKPLQVRCAVIARTKSYNAVDCPAYIVKNANKNANIVILKENWNNDDWLTFLEQLDFDYDDGYGQQEIMGCVWFTDGSWLERGEYDGLEWWEFKQIPAIPCAVERGYL